MTREAESVTQAALALEPEARSALIDRLLQSLHEAELDQIDSLWAKEADARARQIDRGEVELIPGEQVMAQLRARIR